MTIQSEMTSPAVRTWWHRAVPHSRSELIADAVVHGVGLALAIVAGALLLVMAGLHTASDELPALILYVGALILVLAVSFAFNQWPVTPVKRVLARLDQAAIFLLIAGTYTPILALIWDTPAGLGLTIAVWSAAILGIALKLIVPQHFGRLAIILYLGIGFSGMIVFQGLAAAIPESALWLLVTGGLTYSVGIVFHLWERLRFQNVLWHCFVVAGATLHLWAMLDCMVFSRL